MNPLRKQGNPAEPTFVFSCVLDAAAVNTGESVFEALRYHKVEAVMESFEYLKLDGMHELMFRLLDWPTWRYLDSGIFSLMRKAGVHKVQTGTRGERDLRAASIQLFKDFSRYLKKHADEYDYIIEVDADNLPGVGPKFTLQARERLKALVGDKLVPVWHIASETMFHDDPENLGAWKALVRDFPYVAVGGDKGHDRYTSLYRHMVDIAHANGTLVHALGNTSFRDFVDIGWDTGDSTNWKAGVRYGRYTDLIFAKSSKMDPRAMATAMRAEGKIAALGVDREKLLLPGNVGSKYMFGLSRELERQEEVRRIHAGKKPKVSGKGLRFGASRPRQERARTPS